jgi:ABC-type lipoprotein release transport system permease subunit
MRSDVRVSGIAYRFRAELRKRWLGWVALGALIGVVGAMVVVLAAGARRTDTAHERFLTSARAYDLGLATFCAPNVQPFEEPTDLDGCREGVARLPAVADATVLTEVEAVVTDTKGRLLQPVNDDPCYSGPGEIGVYTDPSGRFGRDINRQRIVAGRRADPSRADEVELSAYTAERLGLGPGSELLIHLVDDCGAEFDLDDAIRVRVVGVQRSPGEVAPPSGLFLQTVGVTPAFVDAAGKRLMRGEYLVVRLKPGATLAALQQQATDAGYTAVDVVSRAENEAAISRAISPSATSLAVLALMIALAGVAVLGQLLVRHATTSATDDPMLAALGMSRQRRFALGMARACVIAGVAALVAVVAGVIASPLMPMGLARTVEPDPGLAVDGLVLALGGLATFVFVVAVSALPVWRATAETTSAVETRATPGRAPLSTRIARAGLSPVAVSGARFALERGSGSSAVPVLSSFVGLAISIAAIVAALTFGSSLTHLQSSASLVGWNWDVIVPYPDAEADPDDVRARVRDALDEHPDVAEYAGGIMWPPLPQGRQVAAGPDRTELGGFGAFDGAAPFGPSVIRGRKPSAADEILLGAETLSELGVKIGDEIDVFGQDGTWDEPGAETRTRMRIVGTGVIPNSERIGRGMSVTVDGAALLNDQAREEAFFVRVHSGTDPATLVDAVRRNFPEVPAESIELYGGENTVDPALNLDQISAVPGLFAGLIGVMAAAVMVHVLSAATRARRRDLGVLRVLGFSRAQAMRAVVYQAVIYAAIALAIAIPVGIAFGRFAWHAYARNLYVVPESVTSLTTVAAVAAVTLAITVLVALPPGWLAARVRPAAALRVE